MSPGTTDEGRNGLITIISHNLTGEFGIPISSTLDFVDLEVLIPSEGMLPPGDTVRIPFKLWLSHGSSVSSCQEDNR